jgi:hypothetical protein
MRVKWWIAAMAALLYFWPVQQHARSEAVCVPGPVDARDVTSPGTARIPDVCEWCHEAWPTHCSLCCEICADQTCDNYCEEFPLYCDLCDHDEIEDQCKWEHCYDREVTSPADDPVYEAWCGAGEWEATVPHCTPGDDCWDCCYDWGVRRCWISCEDPGSDDCYRCAVRLAMVCYTNKCGDPEAEEAGRG